MANIQHIAERIFRHVNAGHLPAGYALTMGALIDAYNDDTDFHKWVDTETGSVIEKLITSMVRTGKWNDSTWLRETIRKW